MIDGDLKRDVEAGRFHQDLYYRLSSWRRFAGARREELQVGIATGLFSPRGAAMMAAHGAHDAPTSAGLERQLSDDGLDRSTQAHGRLPPSRA